MSIYQAAHPATSEIPRHSSLSVTLGSEREATVVKVRGPLDFDTVDVLVDVVDSVMAGQPPPRLVLDLSQVTFFCAAGITALLEVRRRTAAGGCSLVLRNPSRITVRVLDITGVHDAFTTARLLDGRRVEAQPVEVE